MDYRQTSIIFQLYRRVTCIVTADVGPVQVGRTRVRKFVPCRAGSSRTGPSPWRTCRKAAGPGDYQSCTFQGLDLHGQDLGGSRFMDCAFEQCDLSRAAPGEDGAA